MTNELSSTIGTSSETIQQSGKWKDVKKIPRFINNDLLCEIRKNTNWKILFQVLNLQKDEQQSKEDDWWALSPFIEEKTASFHLNAKGFFCFATGQGGGVIELVQAFLKCRMGRELNCYEAGRWLLEKSASQLNQFDADKLPYWLDGNLLPTPPVEKQEKRSEEKKELLENKPIRQNLLPSLTQLGEHPTFKDRGISTATCEYLGCGFLEKSKGEMQERIVFQIRGVEENKDGLKTNILSHIGRATTDEQIKRAGKWWHYAGFHKSLEVYNIDKLLLDEKAVVQAQMTGRVLLVEGCFDVAALVEAGIYNSVATFGAHLSERQIPRLKLIAEKLGINSFDIWYDRDEAGKTGQVKAVELLRANGFIANRFDWEKEFDSCKRGKVKIPPNLNDVGDFKSIQLAWLRGNGII